jgi:PAS domain-containing protein
VYKQDAAVSGMLGVVQDVTEQVCTREAIRESEEPYRAFIQHSSEGIRRPEFSPPIDISLPVEAQVAAALP